MSYQIRIEQFPGQPTAIVRRQATKQQLDQVIPEACGTVWSALKSQGIRGGRHVAVYRDQTMNLEIGVEMTQPITPFGEVLASSLPAGKVATTTHFGPYQNLGQAHDAIQQWCATNHHEMTMPCWETYGHWVDEWNNDPSKIRTDVYYLLKS